MGRGQDKRKAVICHLVLLRLEGGPPDTPGDFVSCSGRAAWLSVLSDTGGSAFQALSHGWGFVFRGRR